MRKSKQIKIIAIVVMLIFFVMSFVKVSYGDTVGEAVSWIYDDAIERTTDWMSNTFENLGTMLVEGLVGILTLGIQQFAVLIFKALQLLTTAVIGNVSNGASDAMYAVLFNKVEITSANFFDSVITNQKAASGTIVNNIAQFYNLMRAMSIALLLFVLLYVAIRMAISTVADEKARYSGMLQDWAVSLVLVFMLHYIIILVFYLNGTLVNTLESVNPAQESGVWEDLWVRALVPGAGMDELIVCGAFTVASLAFVLIYIKRAIVLAFLIVISPLITITYAIDKIGDSKSQALNTWMREFMSTVLIQPFHCIIYIIFYSSIMSSMGGKEDLGKMVFAAASALFMLKAENIVKKIFGIAPSSMGDALGTGAMALTAASSVFKGGGKGAGAGGKAGGKGEVPTMRNNESTTLGNIANNVSDKVQKTGIAKDIARQGGLASIAQRKIVGAATLAGAIAGGTVGDVKSAASMATAFGGVAKGISEDIEVKRKEHQLEKNQRVYAGAYKDYVDAYQRDFRATNSRNATQQEIRASIRALHESDGQGLNDYQRDMYDQVKKLARSATAVGHEDGFDFVDYTTEMAQKGVIKPNSTYQQKIYP